MSGLRMNAITAMNDLTSLNENEIKKKKKRVLYPNIRFNLEIKRTNDGNINEYNFNKIMLKALRFKQKLINENGNENASEAIKNALIIEKDFFVERENLSVLISKFEKKISLNKGFNYCDADESESDDNEENVNNNNKSGCEEDLEEEEEEEEESDEEDDDEDDESDKMEEEDVDEESESDDAGENLPRYRTQDFARWADGYDNEDSFIDNTDALEERLPSNKVPKHGKFYVNKAEKIQLVKTKPNLKKSDDEDDSDHVIAKKSARKISSSNSEESIQEIPIKRLKKNEEEKPIQVQNNQQPQTSSLISTQNSTQVKIEKNLQIQNKLPISSSSSSSPILLINSEMQKITTNQKPKVATNANNLAPNTVIAVTAPEVKNRSEEDRIASTTLSRLPDSLKNLLNKIQFILLNQKLDVTWPEEIKTLFINIYIECSKVDMHDKSEIFRYLAFKLSIKKTSLLKRVKKLLEKSKNENEISPTKTVHQPEQMLQTTQLHQQIQHQRQSSYQQPQQQQQQQQRLTPQKQQNEMNLIEKAAQQYHQQQQQQLQHQKLQQQQQQQNQRNVNKKMNNSIEENTLEPDLKEKIMYVIQIFNQTNPRDFTFEVTNYLNSIDSQARKLYNKDMISQIYDFIASSFKIDKDVFMKKLNSIRVDFYEKQLKNSINKFKSELNKEMKSLEEKHNFAYSEFIKKLNEQHIPGQQLTSEEAAKKKIFAPKKKFIWSNELRDLFKNVLSNLQNIFETKEVKSVERAIHLKDFLNKDLLTYWPEGWMQINILFSEAESLLGMKTSATIKKPNLSPQTQMPYNTQMTSNRGSSASNSDAIKINNFVENGATQLKFPSSNSSTSMQQTRKIVPERVQNVALGQQFQQQPIKQSQNLHPSPQRSSTSSQSQQRAQNVSPSQPSKAAGNIAALNQLSSTFPNLTPTQQKLLANTASSTSVNTFLNSILASTNAKAESNDLQNRIKNFYSTPNDMLNKTVISNSSMMNALHKNWPSESSSKSNYNLNNFNVPNSNNSSQNRNDQS